MPLNDSEIQMLNKWKLKVANMDVELSELRTQLSKMRMRIDRLENAADALTIAQP